MTYIGLNTDEYEDRSPVAGKNSLLPPGMYHGIITRAVIKDNSAHAKDPTGKKLEVEFDISHPAQYANRKFWENFNIINREPSTVRIAKEKLSELTKCAGLKTLTDGTELIGREVALAIYVKESKNPQYPDAKNECSKYWPVGTTQAQHDEWRKGGNKKGVPSTGQAAVPAAPVQKAPWAKK